MKIQIAVGGKAYEVEVEGEEPYDAHGRLASIGQLQSSRLPFVPRAGSLSEDDTCEAKFCRSPVAGIVARVHVKAGDRLQVDDLIVVLEAMKMETTVTAPIAGKVKHVNVAPGQAVKRSQVLVELEDLKIVG